MPLGPRSLAIVLAAVFLALGLGVLIGTALPADRLWLQQQQAILDALEKEFASLRLQARNYQEELAALQGERAHLDRLVEALAPMAVEGRLAGETVALVVVGEPARPETEWPEQVNRLLAWAGAGHIWWLHLPAVVATSDETGPGGPVDSPAGGHGGGSMPVVPDGLLDAVLAGDQARLARWAGEGLIALKGEPRPAQGVAVIQQGPVDTRFLAALEDRWQGRNIPVIPGIDGTAGQIALVLKLAGHDPPFTEAGRQ